MSSSALGYGTQIPTYYRDDLVTNEDNPRPTVDEWNIGIQLEELSIADPEDKYSCSAEIGRYGFGNWCLRRALFWTCQIVQTLLCLAILVGIIMYLAQE